MTDDLNRQLLDLAIDLAARAGETAMAMRAEAVTTATSKSSPTDPVTAADRAAEKLIVDGIRSARPSDGVKGEEGAEADGTSGVTWHVDPIDGTTNFLYGLPAYCVSIGVEIDGVMTVGVVNNPAIGEMFSAARSQGARLNGKPIAATTTDQLSMALVATGFGYRPEMRARQAEVVARLLPLIRDLRRMGSAALDLCSLAAGRIDAYYESGLNRWDFAAGLVIATEAGAIVNEPDPDDPDSPLIAANSKLIEPLTALVRPGG